MRTFIIATLVFFVSFATPSFFVLAADNAGTVTTPSGGVDDAGTVVPPAANNNNTVVTLINPLNSGNCTPNGDCLFKFLNSILAFVIRIGTVAVILMLVYVGYLFVVARGEPAKITTARQALLWTVVGALILLGSQAIAEAIKLTAQSLSVGQ